MLLSAIIQELHEHLTSAIFAHKDYSAKISHYFHVTNLTERENTGINILASTVTWHAQCMSRKFECNLGLIAP